MADQISGVLVIIFCATIYIFSYFTQKKQNYTFAVLLLMIGGFTLRIFSSADFFLHPWDEVFHAVVSKHMMLHPLTPTLYETPLLPYDYQNWTSTHIWLNKPPLPFWGMALSMHLFGVNEIALRLPSVILTTIGIWLTWYIGSYLFTKRVGYLAAFLYSVNGFIIEMAAGRIPTDHVDTFFLFFTELAIFFTIIFSRKRNILYNILVGLSLGAAILSKWLPALIILPIWLLIVLDSGNFSIKAIILYFIILLSVTVAVFIPWQIYIYHTFPREAAWISAYNIKHLVEVVDQQGGSIFYHLNKIRINFGELIYLPILWFLWIVFKNITNFKRVAVMAWFIIPLVFFSFAKTKMQGYLLYTAPAAFMITAAFWYWLVDYNIDIELSNKNKIWAKWFINLLLILFIALPIRYCIERIKPFKKDRSPQWVTDLKNMPQKSLKNTVLFNYDRPIDAMFYTDLTVYREIPDRSTVMGLIQRGYTVLVNDNGKVPKDILSLNQIVPVHLTEAIN